MAWSTADCFVLAQKGCSHGTYWAAMCALLPTVMASSAMAPRKIASNRLLSCVMLVCTPAKAGLAAFGVIRVHYRP